MNLHLLKVFDMMQLRVLMAWALTLLTLNHVHGEESQGKGAPELYAYFETPLKDDVGVSSHIASFRFATEQNFAALLTISLLLLSLSKHFSQLDHRNGETSIM